MPACSSEQGGSHRRGGASAPQTNGDIPNAYKETSDREAAEDNQAEDYQKEKNTAIFEEVDSFEELGLRMQELLLTSPKGTRIYLRVRNGRTIN
jgi:hypothetical protein